ncbi:MULTISPECIES: porin [Rhizobium/Agrobacterium group]|uniref:porin n=1 Tax=Rhizobium/Agrobacterium group TaxID=227290 RepID=UPI0003F2196D|nr:MULTISPECIES: porin [Rhizobium/Agrobacterium group]AHK04977.1 outer membrane protein [Agrobacterium tumefaciens LBA4213 (Ach5)]AKC10710.1 membrane protein [Agrobacterium tumefaciens]AYM20093.1 membrane protein [Agrobacterium tumefaciens]AYM71396.1 membrane protein [Agrobacterium tumefaciens]NIB58448.1 porin [Agrobacterium tumefaciens]
MNIKSLLIGSAAALAAVSGAQAADAIVAAEPEPLEYVRVCDAFGTGFFYIPGTETCLKFGGYIRFQTDFGRNESGTSDWDSFTRAQFHIDTRTDTELGALRGFIELRGDADNDSERSVRVNQAFIELSGLRVGYTFTWWDDDLSGETDILSSNSTRGNALRYTYDAGSFYAGISVEELETERDDETNLGIAKGGFLENANNVGISGIIGAKFGVVSANLLGSYDTDYENGAIRAIVTADIGPGTFGLSGAWASGANSYYEESEWTVAAEYAIKATDKLTITPGAQYFGTVDIGADNDFVGDRDAWRAGVTVDYQITQGLATKVTVNYQDVDGDEGIDSGAGDQVTGFVRLQRTF